MITNLVVAATVVTISVVTFASAADTYGKAQF